MAILIFGSTEGTGAVGSFDPWTNAETAGASGNIVQDAENNLVGAERSGFVRLDAPINSGLVYWEVEWQGLPGNEFYHMGFMYDTVSTNDCEFENVDNAHSVIYTFSHGVSGRYGLAVDFSDGTIRAFKSGGELSGGHACQYGIGPGTPYTQTVYPFVGNCNAGGGGPANLKAYFTNAEFTLKGLYPALSSYTSLSGY